MISTVILLGILSNSLMELRDSLTAGVVYADVHPIVLEDKGLNTGEIDVSGEVPQYIITKAIEYGVDPYMAIHVAWNESQFNCNAEGDFSTTTNKFTSFGCWQIHQPAHPEVTIKQAKNIEWSTEWSMKEMKKNGCRIWSTCHSYKNI